MTRLSVFFKGRAIHSYQFESGVVHIGRDESNDITIDSLAVAKAHAAIILRDIGSTIKQLNDDYPLIINGAKTKECALNNNDKISLGKHDILFYTAEANFTASATDSLVNKDVELLNLEINNSLQTGPAANLQIMNGNNIGKILPLKKAMTRLGHTGSGIVAIAKRKEGFFISALEESETISVNNQPINGASRRLQNNDMIIIDNTSLQFFMN
ncbi:MAG: FHA domain-containing protein [Methylococcaceae bacterium]|jgi:pSer/pThr/pTyr-binding forkhead associated (FHA) protein